VPIRNQGGTVQGDIDKGVVSMPTAAGEVEFKYHAYRNKLDIEVLDQPFLVSCGLIQGKIADALRNVPPPAPINTQGETVFVSPSSATYTPEFDVTIGEAEILKSAGAMEEDFEGDIVIVSALQELLRKLGAPDTPALRDGLWGPATATALRMAVDKFALPYGVHVIDMRRVMLPTGVWDKLKSHASSIFWPLAFLTAAGFGFAYYWRRKRGRLWRRRPATTRASGHCAKSTCCSTAALERSWESP
jgi:hypothetical protein